MKTKIAIIGGGPAGLAAAIAAYDGGVTDITVFERENKLGGILNQCIHNGFGLHRFKESLTGPEYAGRFIDETVKRGIRYYTGTTVLGVSADKEITAVNPELGVFKEKADAVILAMGCRERSRGAINVAGSRPAGIYSAGTAQKYANVKGYLVGKSVVILGSGDIGLIMARRMTLEGATVKAVCEIMPFSTGLKRNIAQCLDDFGIPLYLSHTITEIRGKDRVTGVTVARVDENKRPVKGTEKYFDCDTVLFSVGLIPENELTSELGAELSPATKGAIVYDDRETTVSGVFACGNVLQVHDLVDFVSEESEIAGRAAADYVINGKKQRETVVAESGENVAYVLPQKIDAGGDKPVKLYFRVKKEMRDVSVTVTGDSGEIIKRPRKIVVPGEMETVTVLPSAVKGNGKIILSVK